MKTAIATLVYFAAAIPAVILCAPSFEWTALLLFYPAALVVVSAGFVFLRLHVFVRRSLPEAAAGGWWAMRERMRRVPLPLRELLKKPWSWGLSAPVAGADAEDYLRQAKRQMSQFILAVFIAFVGALAGMFARLHPGGI